MSTVVALLAISFAVAWSNSVGSDREGDSDEEYFGPLYDDAHLLGNASGVAVKVSAVNGSDAGCMANPSTVVCATIQGGVNAAQRSGIETVALLPDGVYGISQCGVVVYLSSSLTIIGFTDFIASAEDKNSTARPVIDCGDQARALRVQVSCASSAGRCRLAVHGIEFRGSINDPYGDGTLRVEVNRPIRDDKGSEEAAGGIQTKPLLPVDVVVSSCGFDSCESACVVDYFVKVSNATVSISDIRAADISQGSAVGVHFNSNATNVNVSVSEINAKNTSPALSFAGGAVDVWFGQQTGNFNNINGYSADTIVSVSKVNATNTKASWGGGGGAVHVANYGPSTNTVVSVSEINATNTSSSTELGGAVGVTFNCGIATNASVSISKISAANTFAKAGGGVVGVAFKSASNSTSVVVSEIDATHTSAVTNGGVVSVSFFGYYLGCPGSTTTNTTLSAAYGERTGPGKPFKHVLANLATINSTVFVSNINATGCTSLQNGGVVAVDYSSADQSLEFVTNNPTVSITDINALNTVGGSSGGAVSVTLAGTTENVSFTASRVNATNTSAKVEGGAIELGITGKLTNATVAISKINAFNTSTYGNGGAVSMSFNGDGAGGSQQLYSTTTNVSVFMSEITATNTSTGGGSGGAISVQFTNSTESVVKIDQLVAFGT